MLYNQNNLNVAKMAAKSDIRPVLAGLHFMKDRTVATDSSRLLEVTVPSDTKDRLEDFPISDSGIKPLQNIEPFTVPAKDILDIKLPKNKTLPVLNNLAIKSNNDETVELYTNDLNNVSIKTLRKAIDNFPDYEQIMPTGDPVAELTLNSKMLAEMLIVMGKIDKTGYVKIKMYADKNKPLVLIAESSDQKARGLLMPIKTI